MWFKSWHIVHATLSPLPDRDLRNVIIENIMKIPALQQCFQMSPFQSKYRQEVNARIMEGFSVLLTHF